MKKLLLSFSMAVIGGMIFAQTVTCPNVTMTNTNGATKTLYTELAAGKTIILDLFYNECGWCQTYAPKIEQAYVAHGAGIGNVDVWGVNTRAQSDASINAYKTTWGVSNQCFGGTAAQQFFYALAGAFAPGQTSFGIPLYAVICPNKKGSWKVNYPPTATGFDSYITACQASGVGVNNLERDENQARFTSIYPNPGNNQSKVDFFLPQSSKVEITVYNVLGAKVGVIANDMFDAGEHTLDFSAMFMTPGNYTIHMTIDNGVADVAKLVIVNK